MKAKFKINVGLVIHNGENYLEEQLNSLVAQEDVDLNLYVLDNDSVDRSIEILSSHQIFDQVRDIWTINQVSPCDAFVLLIKLIPADFPLALCDQDDIWEPNKLAIQLRVLENGNFDIVSSCRSVFSSADKNRLLKEKCIVETSFENALVENIVFSNTMVINKRALEIAKNLTFASAVMHDAYLYLYFSVFGRVCVLSDKLVKYRLHESNAVGLGKRNLCYFYKTLEAFANQSLGFAFEYQSRLPIKEKKLLESHIKFLMNRNLYLRIINLWTLKVEYHSKPKKFLAKILYIVLRIN